jgi:Tfp pilus assembly protein PilF
MDKGNWKKAEKSLVKSLEFDNSSTVPYVFLASIFLIQEKNKRAIQYLERALNAEGDIDEVCYNLAVNYAILGDINTAKMYVKKCLEIDNEYPNAKELKEDLDCLIAINKLKITL